MEYAERRAFGMTIKITATKEILDRYYCETFVSLTEIVVSAVAWKYLYTLSDQLIFTSSLIRYFFTMFSGRFAHSNDQLQSRISLPAYSQWFYFFFSTTPAVGRSLTFRVAAYSRDRLIGEEIRYYYNHINDLVHK